ncbi:MAG: ABC-F family ATP-binding cassette domain-containing protein [Oscillospiraceae bacterium]|nr:ABC-F family ATP-binding cassette domain-containing protein [Oscillospiraceae bacterium]
MIDISVKNLIKSFEIGDNLLDGLTFQVDSGERVGILGKNGCGKTTLFKILTGEYDYDEGELAIAPGKKLGLISQIPVYPEGYTVEDVLDTAFARLHKKERELEELAARMAAGDSSRGVLERYDSLSHSFEAEGGYDTTVRLGKVCNGLEIPPAMRAQQFDQLSGGEKTRVNLARLILEDTDILLLDEPTNHLDLHATEWLEEYLDHFKGTVLAISHDRYFLDRVVGRIIEIERGKAQFYSGNYSFYTVEKERRYLEQLRQYEKEQAKIAQLEEAAEKLRLWAFKGMDKTYKRAFSMEKRIERMRTQDKPIGPEKAIRVGFSQQEFKGDMLFTAENISKSYGGRCLFSSVELEVLGGERIAILGDNGTGKTTFLKLLLEEERPDTGKFRFGPTVKYGYLPQIVIFDHPERNLFETLLWEDNCSAQEARDRLGAFRFRGEDVFKPVATLSGGERSRLKLCQLMAKNINLLILDEPTNHLDITSREWIESSVEDFEGALLFVSHDRYFIDRFATRIWFLEDGRITDFRGDYQAWLKKKAREEELRGVPRFQPEKKPKKEKVQGGTKQLEKDLRAAERRITRLEEEQAALEEAMALAATDYQKLQELTEAQTALEEQLTEAYEKWEELSEQLAEADR